MCKNVSHFRAFYLDALLNHKYSFKNKQTNPHASEDSSLILQLCSQVLFILAPFKRCFRLYTWAGLIVFPLWLLPAPLPFPSAGACTPVAFTFAWGPLTASVYFTGSTRWGSTCGCSRGPSGKRTRETAAAGSERSRQGNVQYHARGVITRVEWSKGSHKFHTRFWRTV